MSDMGNEIAQLLNGMTKVAVARAMVTAVAEGCFSAPGVFYMLKL